LFLKHTNTISTLAISLYHFYSRLFLSIQYTTRDWTYLLH